MYLDHATHNDIHIEVGTMCTTATYGELHNALEMFDHQTYVEIDGLRLTDEGVHDALSRIEHERFHCPGPCPMCAEWATVDDYEGPAA